MEREKVTKDIGELTGRILVFGGVYSNLQAWEKLWAIAQKEGIPASNVICTGDVVGYCAQPEEVVQAVKNSGMHSIAGNVEIQLREGQEDCGCDFNDGSRCDIFSRQWYPFAQEKLSSDSIGWMHELPDFIRFRSGARNFTVVHGSYFNTSGYVFASTPWSTKQENLEAAEAEVILAGHCGLPFNQQENGMYWLNPGVIGMPANDGTTRVWYMILESTEAGLHFEHRSFEYDHAQAAQLMKELHLPQEYALTLGTGIWDNCEILPDRETAEQGVALVL